MAEKEHRQELVRLVRTWFGGAPHTGAEVGVQTGKTSALLLREFQKLTLWMIDRWGPPPEDSAYYRCGDPAARHSPEEYAQQKQQALTLTEFAADRRRVFCGVSTDQELRSVSLDWAFLDASHVYEDCRRDIEFYWPLVKPGGVLSGHDYHEFADTYTDGVKQAVDEWITVTGLELHTARGRIWWVRKP